MHRRSRRRAPDGCRGSSDVSRAGVVAYANDVKIDQLGVPEALIDTHGAVSAEVAEAMARGVRERLGVDVGVAVTGVAGPDGGTDEKPVGSSTSTSRPRTGARRGVLLPADRDTVRSRATVAALHLARRVLTQSRHEDV